MTWVRASFCNIGGCVEVEQGKDEVRMRDGKDADSPVLAFTHDEWAAFMAGVKAGEFDL